MRINKTDGRIWVVAQVDEEKGYAWPWAFTVDRERRGAIKKYVDDLQEIDPGLTWKRRKRSKYPGIKCCEVIKVRIVLGWEEND